MIGKLLGKLIFAVSGWKISGEIPKEVEKCVAIGAPHTSNWDFIFTVSALKIYGYPAKYLIKDVFFKNPLYSWIFYWTGGIHVDRSKSNNLTGELKKMIEGDKPVYILFSPEGTRKKVTKWKSGFYHVAIDCKLPIALGFLDYKKKEAGFMKMFQPTGNKDADLVSIVECYRDITPCNPEKFSFDVLGKD